MGAWQSPLQEEGDGGLARKKNSSCHMSPLDECPAIGGRNTSARARAHNARPQAWELGGWPRKVSAVPGAIPRAGHLHARARTPGIRPPFEEDGGALLTVAMLP